MLRYELLIYFLRYYGIFLIITFFHHFFLKTNIVEIYVVIKSTICSLMRYHIVLECFFLLIYIYIYWLHSLNHSCNQQWKKKSTNNFYDVRFLIMNEIMSLYLRWTLRPVYWYTNYYNKKVILFFFVFYKRQAIKLREYLSFTSPKVNHWIFSYLIHPKYALFYIFICLFLH